MADCNTIESLLNQLVTKVSALESGQSDILSRLSSLERRASKIENDLAFLVRKNVEQDKNIDILFKEVARLNSLIDQSLKSRVERLEMQMRAQISFTANLKQLIDKLKNDLGAAIILFQQRIAAINAKNQEQDNRLGVIEGALALLAALIPAVAALGKAVFVLGKGLAKLGSEVAKLIASQKRQDIQIALLRRFRPQRGQKGEKGDKGNKGDKGDKGDRGKQGERGEQGIKGDKGDKGQKGDQGVKGDRGQNGRNGGRGQQGQQGIKGDRGQQGEKGQQGQQGIKGDKGDEGKVKVVETVKVVEKPRIIETTKVVEKIREVKVTELVYRQPDLSEVLSRLAEVRSKLIYNSSVEVLESCEEGQVVTTEDLPEFLNALEDKLTGIEALICDRYELDSYSLGSFSQPTTVNLQPETKFIKITINEFPDGISRRFSRVSGQPNNYQFGFVSFESDYGLSPEFPWEWINSYFYPMEEDKPNKVHVYSNYLNTQYTITAYKVKTS